MSNTAIEETDEVVDFDPNLVLCGKLAVQNVKLTFGMWKYRKTFETEVTGNCTGMDVIDAAITNVYDNVLSADYFEGEEYPYVIMKDPSDPEHTMQTVDEDLQGDSWLADMLISAEITSIEPV